MDTRILTARQYQSVLQVCFDIIRQESFEAINHAKVAVLADVPEALLREAYPNVDVLLEDLIDALMHQYEGSYFAQLDAINDPEERLRAVLDIVFGDDWLDVSEPSVFYGFFYLSFANKKVRQRFQRMYTWFKDLLCNEVDIWKKAGVISRDLLTEQVADFIITLNEGATYYYYVFKDRQAYIRRSQMLKSMVRSYLDTPNVRPYIV